jgi:hypothetical protein
MEVQHTITITDQHRIEIGSASWDATHTSIRNRYDGDTGRFSPRASSEIPLHDLEPLMRAVAQFHLIDPASCARIIAVLAASIEHQAAAVP